MICDVDAMRTCSEWLLIREGQRISRQICPRRHDGTPVLANSGNVVSIPK